jgi:tetratricopeptide (TPR) repeat protein
MHSLNVCSSGAQREIASSEPVPRQNSIRPRNRKVLTVKHVWTSKLAPRLQINENTGRWHFGEGQGQLQEAINEQKSALRLHAEDVNGWNNLGVFEARSGDTEAVRYDFQQALRIDPDNTQAKANLSHLPHKP